MKSVVNQSLLDVSIQQNGSVLCVVDWALKNNMSITDVIEPGTTLHDPESEFRDFDVLDYLSGRNIATVADDTNSSIVFNFGTITNDFNRSDIYRTTVKQSLFDVAIESDGSVMSSLDWALKNNISLTAVVPSGKALQIPASNNRNKEVALYFSKNRIRIATDYENQASYLDYLLPNIFPLSL